MSINKEKCLEILQDKDYYFKSSFCRNSERNAIKKTDIGWHFR